MLTFRNAENSDTLVFFNDDKTITIEPNSVTLSASDTKMLTDNLIHHVYPELIQELKKVAGL